jgi:ABC-type proline/glycine betaine transport system ATPase subunit
MVLGMYSLCRQFAQEHPIHLMTHEQLLLGLISKTTTMGMLTAEFPPTSGDATLAGFSVRHQPEKTRRRIGYCPQFDAHFENVSSSESWMSLLTS